MLAAQNAARIFANQEAVAMARRGNETLDSEPATPERDPRELALQITLGPALFATKDWTAADLEKAYTRAHVLCRELGESPDLFPALWGLFLFRIARLSEQRYDTIRRRRSENDVGRLFKDGVEIEHRAERFAHLVKRAENVCLALQGLKHFVALR